MLAFLGRWILIVILWADDELEIFGIKCPPLNSSNSGKISYFPSRNISDCEYPVGTLAKIQCEEFYVAEGNHTSECLKDGNWSTTALTCYPDCGKSSEMVSLIVHGSVALPGFSPWHVGMYHKVENEFEFWCGGTLISDSAVITAAHCTWKVKPHNLRLVFGKFYRDFKTEDINSQILRVSKIETLKSYQDALGNYNGDLSVIFLKNMVKFNNFVRPACIDWDQRYMDEQLKEGSIGTVAGWGLTENDTFSDYLRVVNLPVASDEICINQQNTVFRKFITYTTFCAGFNNGTGVCNGDSGGGLVFYDEKSERWFIQGLVSVSPRRKGTSFCDPNFFAIFTKVNMFTRWLKSINIFNQRTSKSDFEQCLPKKEKKNPYKYIRKYFEKESFVKDMNFPHNEKLLETAFAKYQNH